MIKGLDVSRQFFFEWGLPVLQQEFPQYANRIAAGRLLGSDLLGGDDEVSRDHNWGPQFFLFLTEEDFRQIGAQLSEVLNAAAPNPWDGYRLAGKNDRSVIVVSIPIFFEKLLDLNGLPASARDWPIEITTHESELYFIRHGAIFQDPLGELSRWRKALHEYPRHLRMKRLAEECDRIWHRGEYNFVQRMVDRDDPLTHYICLGQFIDAVMQLYLLVAGDFTPYWKWLPQEFRKQASAEQVEPLLTRLVASSHKPEQIQFVKEICGIVHQHLLISGLVTGEGANPDQLPLLNDRHELRAQSKTIW